MQAARVREQRIQAAQLVGAVKEAHDVIMTDRAALDSRPLSEKRPAVARRFAPIIARARRAGNTAWVRHGVSSEHDPCRRRGPPWIGTVGTVGLSGSVRASRYKLLG